VAVPWRRRGRLVGRPPSSRARAYAAGIGGVLVHFEGAAYENSVPLHVAPEPDTSIRVYLVAKPLEGPVAVAPQRVAPPPKRRGFTLVEWGGALLQ
jgi:hypothetical protein